MRPVLIIDEVQEMPGSFPSSQQTELVNFVRRFLLDTAADTAIMKTDGNLTFDQATWVDWDVPALE